jgi:filamin
VEKVVLFCNTTSGTSHKTSTLIIDNPFQFRQVSYVPTEEGNHDIHLKYDGDDLPDSPFPITAMEGCDPHRVKAYGDGLERGICDEPNAFTIETKNAGAGGLGLAIEGPAEALMNCEDNKDGTATVEYVPPEEGDYDITIKFGDEDIPGSPFKVGYLKILVAVWIT